MDTKYDDSRPVFMQIAAAFSAYKTCRNRIETGENASHWTNRSLEWKETIEELCKRYLRSGFACGTRFDFEQSTPKRLVFKTEFHHMNTYGYYDGWTQHRVIVTPSFFGFDTKVTGSDRNNIKEYIASSMDDDLSKHVPYLAPKIIT